MAVETPLFVNGNRITKENGAGQQVLEYKWLFLSLAATVDAADTTTIDLAKYGGSTFLGVVGCKHTTDNSVVVTENPTTAVSGTTITFTIPAGTDNDPRYWKVFYK